MFFFQGSNHGNNHGVPIHHIPSSQVLEDGYKLSPLDAYTCPNEGSLEEVELPRSEASVPHRKTMGQF